MFMLKIMNLAPYSYSNKASGFGFGKSMISVIPLIYMSSILDLAVHFWLKKIDSIFWSTKEM